MNTASLIAAARNEKWSRKQVKQACFDHKISLAEREAVYAALGMAATQAVAETAAPIETKADVWPEGISVDRDGRTSIVRGLSESAKRHLRFSGAWRDAGDALTIARKVAPREIRIAIDAGREADLRAAQVREQREAEQEEFVAVEPHWPTYRTALALAGECAEAADARRYRDVKDAQAFGGAAEKFWSLARECGMKGQFESLVRSVMERGGTEGQRKAVAVGLAKRMTAKLAAGASDTAAMIEQIAAVAEATGAAHATGKILNVRPAKRERKRVRISLRMIASKKINKPYLAICGDALKHEFVDGTKFTNTSRAYEATLEPGAIIHFRGATWNRTANAFASDDAYALVLEDGVYQIDRQTASDYDSQRAKGWTAVRRDDSVDRGAATVLLVNDATEAEYMLTRPAVLIADAAEVNDDDESESSSPVLTCWIAK